MATNKFKNWKVDENEIMRAVRHNGHYNCISKFTLDQVETLYFIKHAGYLHYYVPGIIQAIHAHNDIVRFGEHHEDCAANCPLDASDFIVVGKNEKGKRVYWIERY
jgi:hypothetical protein